MKPAAFAYARPDTVEDALAMLSEYGEDARILAGGQSLAAMLNMRLVTPSVLIDISDLAELGKISKAGEMIKIGASVTQEAMLNWPGLSALPVLKQILPWVGHYQTRQRGTVCGSLVHADPSSELPLALRVLDGDVMLRSARGHRVVPAQSFQIGAMQTCLDADEMVIAVRFPVVPKGTISAFREVGPRRGDFAIVAVAAVGDADGVVFGIAGVADTPAIHRLAWREVERLDDTLVQIARTLPATNDIHAPASYRRVLVRTLGAQVIKEVDDALSRL